MKTEPIPAPHEITAAQQDQERYDEFAELLRLREDVKKLRQALQSIADSTDGNNPSEAVFYFTAINALKG